MPVAINSTFQTSRSDRTAGFASIERALHRLSPALARAVSETAEAFFPGHQAGIPDLVSPRISETASLRCSQTNIGERYEMVCGLSVDGASWKSLFGASAAGEFGADVLGEMANCVCGSLLSEPGFLDEFGQLFPCVPSMDEQPCVPEARCLKGAVRVSGTWIHFTFAIRDRAGAFSPSEPLAAAA